MPAVLPALLCVAFLFLLAGSAASAATGEEIYRARCGLCHDGGAAGAPKIDDRAAWLERLAEGKETVYQSALKGKPDTAMLPKGGFPELSDADVRAAVDYMLARTGLPDGGPARPRIAVAPTAAVPAASAAPADDRAITAAVAEALRHSRDVSPPTAQLETDGVIITVRGTGIKVETQGGVVTLRGVVEQSAVVSRAETVAKGVAGVKSVDNKLISSSIFEHD